MILVVIALCVLTTAIIVAFIGLWNVANATDVRLDALGQETAVLRYRIDQLERKPEPSPQLSASEIIRKKREEEVEAKKREHGPQPVSWVGKAALLEHLTEDPRFERAQKAHEEL